MQLLGGFEPPLVGAPPRRKSPACRRGSVTPRARSRRGVLPRPVSDRRIDLRANWLRRGSRDGDHAHRGRACRGALPRRARDPAVRGRRRSMSRGAPRPDRRVVRGARAVQMDEPRHTRRRGRRPSPRGPSVVAAARYDRDFPHTLRIFVEPEQPAVVRRGADSWLVSARARVIAGLRLGNGAAPAHLASEAGRGPLGGCSAGRTEAVAGGRNARDAALCGAVATTPGCEARRLTLVSGSGLVASATPTTFRSSSRSMRGSCGPLAGCWRVRRLSCSESTRRSSSTLNPGG